MNNDGLEINIDLNVPLNQENQVDQVELRTPVPNQPAQVSILIKNQLKLKKNQFSRFQAENPPENVPNPPQTARFPTQNAQNTTTNHLNAARYVFKFLKN